MAHISFTDRELDIMSVLWEKGSGTVAEVREAITDPLAYTTVLTMLRILEQKGVVRHKPDGRAHVYYPCIERDDAATTAVSDVLRSFFANSKTALAVRLMSEEKPNAQELASIKELIARYEEETR